MKKGKILVPTDFSTCAHNALQYALGLAKDIDAELVLLHSITYPNTPYSNLEITEEESTKKYNEAKENLDAEVAFARTQNAAIPVKSILEGGFAELSISSVIEAENIDFIVMGTEGASGIKSVVFGSFTHNVILVATCPVFTIPLTGKYRGIKNIVCTTEMNKTEIKAVKALVSLAKKINAAITFFNVSKNAEEQNLALEKFENLVKELTDYPQIEYVVTESNDIVESIDSYVCEINPDLIVTLGREKNFFTKLFGPHVTKKLCMHTQVPLLSFPNAALKETENTDLIKKTINK